ncbi:hypothetical protein [Thalassotalea sp. G2M2-11]|uniref:hypothetical protein n=1 Tax=Thalassotalea sp. G2M2-11 TaxID=2787627 RepID=UPI0019D08B36|nr:hypothetical protein [Thalassotalea sp. G2M2-11]
MVKFLVTIMFLFGSAIGSAASLNLEMDKINEGISQKPEQYFYELQAQLNDDISIYEKVKLQVIISELAYYIDQPEKILYFVQEAISSGVLNDFWYTRALINKSRGHFQRRESNLHLITAQMAYVKAKSIGEPSLETAALLEVILANIQLNKDSQRAHNLKLVKKYLSFLDDDLYKAILLQRYTTILRSLERFEEASKISQDTIKIFKQLGSLHFTSISYYNFARVEEFRGNFQAALKAMELSYRWALKDNNYLNQAFSLTRMAQYQEKLQLVEDAEKSLLLAQQSAFKTQSSRVQLLMYKNIAEFSCRLHDDTCYSKFETAIEHANANNLKQDKVELQRQLSKIYATNGQYQKAYEVLSSTID